MIPASIAALPSRRPELSALLERWAAINSGSDHGAGLARMAEALRETFSTAFPAAALEILPADAPGHNPPGAVALRYRLRPTAPLQVLPGLTTGASLGPPTPLPTAIAAVSPIQVTASGNATSAAPGQDLTPNS